MEKESDISKCQNRRFLAAYSHRNAYFNNYHEGDNLAERFQSSGKVKNLRVDALVDGKKNSFTLPTSFLPQGGSAQCQERLSLLVIALTEKIKVMRTWFPQPYKTLQENTFISPHSEH